VCGCVWQKPAAEINLWQSQRLVESNNFAQVAVAVAFAAVADGVVCY